MSTALTRREIRVAPSNETWRGDDVWDAQVLFERVQRVGDIARMLIERFAVVAGNHEQRPAIEPSPFESGDESGQRRVALVQGVAITIEIALACRTVPAWWRHTDDALRSEDT